MRGVAAARLLGVLEVIEPVGCGDELGSRTGLQVEPRKAFVEAVAHAPRDGVTVRVGRHVRVGERMAATECEERPEPEPGFRARLEQRVTDQQLRAAVDPKQLLFQRDAAYAVGDRGGRRVVEVDDVFVTARLINARETVNREVEALVVLDDRFVDRRKEHVIFLLLVVARADYQSMVLARVAAYHRGTDVPPGAVGAQHFAPQRVFEVAQFVFVKM